jgi:hypothetical protein
MKMHQVSGQSKLIAIVNSTGAIVEIVFVEIAIYAPMIHTARA